MSIFETVKGISIPFPEKINEGFEIKLTDQSHTHITANISANKIDFVFTKLVSLVIPLGFFVIEIPTNQKDEKDLRKSDNDPCHRDVYYLDGLELNEFFNIYNEFKELLIHDGEINFGFGSHNGIDEVLVGSYKIFSILTDDPNKYLLKFDEMGFSKYDNLAVAQDTFSENHPGSRSTIRVNGKLIYDIPEILKDRGMYFSKRIED
ncbi:MAG: hypothetical protein EHM45_02330 [Desulfobacteraceae bacterium]|nr:MAG: hypothetical protein EHM45_02330 [Desulfobacteraceae bacterium]